MTENKQGEAIPAPVAAGVDINPAAPVAAAAAAAGDGAAAKSNTGPKRKVAMYVAYLGAGYHVSSVIRWFRHHCSSSLAVGAALNAQACNSNASVIMCLEANLHVKLMLGELLCRCLSGLLPLHTAQTREKNMHWSFAQHTPAALIYNPSTVMQQGTDLHQATT
jgi:hypothetical protein